MSAFGRNLEEIRKRIDDAARRSGRNPAEVTLVAVSKLMAAERVREALFSGHREFGENRVQEARAKIPEVGPEARWHLVGHLQRNKAREAAGLFQVIHSVDSVSLLEALSRHAGPRKNPLEVLIQVDLAGEEQKHGATEAELPGILAAASGLPYLSVMGLMILPPYHPDPEQSRPYFRRLAELARKIERENFDKVSMRDLSMGMTEDFEVAVEEGATYVRIGRALFGERPARPGKETE